MFYPPPTFYFLQYLRWSLLGVCLVLAGCDNIEKMPSANDENQVTHEQILNGALPELDRSDDLAGIDANQNGVRDDIEQYIAKNTYTAEQSAAATRFAAFFQQMLKTDISSPQQLDVLQPVYEKAFSCAIETRFGSHSEIEGVDFINHLIAVQFDTMPRFQKSLEYDRIMQTRDFKQQPKEQACAA